jgi:hypothetical protein
VKQPKRTREGPQPPKSGAGTPRHPIGDGNLTIAMHHAGHAVSAVVLGLGLKFVDLTPRRSADGRIRVGCTVIEEIDAGVIYGKGEEAVFPHLIQCFAGGLAESLIDGQEARRQDLPAVPQPGAPGSRIRVHPGRH